MSTIELQKVKARFAYAGHKTNRSALAQGTIFVLLYALFYGALVPGLIRDWWENSTYSYGMLIPFVALYLVWDCRREIATAPIAPEIRGVVPLAIALSLGLVGEILGDSFIGRISMILALGSSVYLLFGRAMLAVLLFPICYLALMIPLPYVVVKEIAYQLRFLDASLAALALQLLGIPVYREAYFLHLPNIVLEVADVCAGLASVFALFALGTFYVYFLPLAVRLKALLLLSTFPIAIFVNLVRIILTSVLAYYIGPVTLEMVFHRFAGTTTFLLALVLLVGLAEYFRKKWPASAQTDPRVSSAPIQLDNAPTVDWKSFGLGVATFIGALSISLMLNGGRSTALAGAGFADLPRSIGDFAVVQIDWQNSYADPKADDSTSRIYAGPEKTPIEIFLGYKRSQNASGRLQSPKLMTGQDWNFVWVKPADLSVDGSSRLETNWMLVRSGNAARLVLYWYQFGHTSEASELGYRINLARRLVFERRSDAAVIRLATSVSLDEPIEKAQERLSAFARQLHPELMKILPE